MIQWILQAEQWLSTVQRPLNLPTVSPQQVNGLKKEVPRTRVTEIEAYARQLGVVGEPAAAVTLAQPSFAAHVATPTTQVPLVTPIPTIGGLENLPDSSGHDDADAPQLAQGPGTSTPTKPGPIDRH